MPGVVPSHLSSPAGAASLLVLIGYPKPEILDALQSRYHLTEADAQDALAIAEEDTLSA